MYFGTLLLFVVLGLGLFYQHQFAQYIEEELLSAERMMNVAAQSVADSAVIGDYDTISKTLERAIARSHFAKAQFIDGNGGVITATNTGKNYIAPPQWLVSQIQNRLFDVNHNISIGGKDYGVMRLTFAGAAVASELFVLALWTLGLAVAALAGGVVLIRIPLKRWLGNFDRVRSREIDILSGDVEVSALLDPDAPEEIRHTFEILSRAAGKLTAQREEAAVTLNSISDGVLTIDTQRRVVYCNPAAEQLLGITDQSAVGRLLSDVLPPHFRMDEQSVDWTVQRLEFVDAAGKKTILDATLCALHSANQDVSGHVLAMRDVTRQHALDQQLRAELLMRQRALESLRSVLDAFVEGQDSTSPLQSEDLDALTTRVVGVMNERELSRQALDNQKFALDQHAIVSITNLQGEITYANDRFCQISGFARDELIGANHRIVKSGYHEDVLYKQMWGEISHGRVWHGEVCNRAKDGHLYWVDATIVPLMGLDGMPEQYIAIRTDISVRKNFEAQIAEQLRFVEVLLEATPTAIYLKGVDGRYLRFNKAFEELFGIDRKEWIGKTVLELVDGDSARTMRDKDLELFANLRIQSYEASFTNRKTGKVRDGLYWKAPLTNAAGEVTALVGTILDITEKNRFEQELRDAKRSAEAASQAKSDFLANMSHEIRTPMNGVIGMTDLALDTELSTAQREYLTIVKTSAQSLMVILNDILDFSKIEAGKLNIEDVSFKLEQSVLETLKTIRARADKKQLTLTCTLAPDLPESVLGDPVRIGQVLTNLCDNAIKFTQQGSVNVVVLSRPVQENTIELHYSVQDTGIGIPADKLQHVFEAFSQADTSTTRKYGGTGLGLTICARLVQLMGGRIWVESTLGEGSTFHFTVQVHSLEVVLSTIGEVPTRDTGALLTAEAAPSVSLQVLLVEDHPINQILATTLLKKWGHSVVVAKNGQEAVDIFPSQHWDLVLMDMQMPVMGGLEATRLIRATEIPNRRTPIIAMTANAMESDKQACLEAGMDDHLSKPFNATALQTILERLTA